MEDLENERLHRPGPGRPLVRLRVHARLPRLRRLVGRARPTSTSCRSSPRSPAGSPADAPVLFAEFGQSTATARPASGRPPGQRGRRRQVHRRNARRAARRRIDRRAALVLRRLRRATSTDNRRSTLPYTSGPSGCGAPTGRPNRQSPRSADGGADRAQRPPGTRPWLDITVDEFDADRRHHLTRLYRRYVQGLHGAVIRQCPDGRRGDLRYARPTEEPSPQRGSRAPSTLHREPSVRSAGAPPRPGLRRRPLSARRTTSSRGGWRGSGAKPTGR